MHQLGFVGPIVQATLQLQPIGAGTLFAFDKETLLHNLMRASIGDYTRKKMVVGLGRTNSGKGLTIQLAKTAFGAYCLSFNGNSMLARYNGTESALEVGWSSASRARDSLSRRRSSFQTAQTGARTAFASTETC